MSVEPFDAVDVIRIKRDGGVVPEAALRWLIDAYTRGYVSDAQMASFAMAVFQRGMQRDEIRVMTDAMIASGERMSFANLGKRTVDKHSTGGVGDKITLPLAPLVKETVKLARGMIDRRVEVRSRVSELALGMLRKRLLGTA